MAERGEGTDQFSRSLAGWAPGLKQLIGEIIKQRVPQDPKLHRLTKAEKDTIAGWQAHFDCGHLPFRHGLLYLSSECW